MNIKDLRVLKGLTQKELGLKLGCVQSVISKVEDGIIELTLFQQGKLKDVERMPDYIKPGKDELTTIKINDIQIDNITFSYKQKFRDLKNKYHLTKHRQVFEKLIDISDISSKTRKLNLSLKNTLETAIDFDDIEIVKTALKQLNKIIRTNADE